MSFTDWDKVRYFNPKVDKFPEDPDLYADPKLIYAIDKYRHILGFSVHPSPVPGALARFSGSQSSRHYAKGRQSDAIDVFAEGPATYSLTIAMTCGIWGGIGFYPFTRYKSRDWPMLHLDLRTPGQGKNPPYTFIWIRDKDDSYLYPQIDPKARKRFLEILHKMALHGG